MTDYVNWFEDGARPYFEKGLLPLAGKPNLKFVQLGVFTGNASVWMHDNVLTHPLSQLWDVDTWEGGSDLADVDFHEVWALYNARVRGRPRIHTRRETTNEFFRSPPYEGRWADFIYIDADHTEFAVLLDALHSHCIIKSGGIIAFDDVIWGIREEVPLRDRPEFAIRSFLHATEGSYKYLGGSMDANQLWIERV